MIYHNNNYRLLCTLSILLCLSLGISSAWADQVSLAYVDANSDAQTLVLDCNTSATDLALAASLMGENGVGATLDAASGCGSLTDLAAALAAAAPVYAASVAETLAALSPDNAQAIADAVNAVPGVNTTAVLAAVHFGPVGTNVGPQSFGSDSAIGLEPTQIEQVPSGN